MQPNKSDCTSAIVVGAATAVAYAPAKAPEEFTTAWASAIDSNLLVPCSHDAYMAGQVGDA